jgi:hypothetical protein
VTLVVWYGGPHDLLEQHVADDVELRLARVCECHGALYVADVFDGETWRLRYRERWFAA